MSKTKGPETMGTGASSPSKFATLKTAETQLTLQVTNWSRPHILYWGPALSHASADEINLLSERQWVHGGPAIDVQSSLSNELGAGLAGPSGFVAHRESHDWAAMFRVQEIDQTSDHQLVIRCHDDNLKIGATYYLSLDPETDVLSAYTQIENGSEKPLAIEWCAALCLPLDRQFYNLKSFNGRWAHEFQRQHIPAFRGSFVRENKSGRTGHDTFPALIATANFTSQTRGPAAGFHLGWSGNSRIRADRHADGRAFVQMGELFFPDEMEIANGGTYKTPTLYAAWSEHGMNGVSQKFHDHLKTKILDGRIAGKTRPVHYNTWEAVYFDHSEEKLIGLAEKAAAVGAERFVLDDGWFGGRRDDKAGLGDWWVSKEVYPEGLGKLANRVRELGMEFGIWFEPEMVNPDSELYRAHPDWILEAKGVEQVPFRDQYTLDLTRAEVSNHLFEQISAIVTEYDVAYIKWDMNRDIHHPGSAGRGAIHRQTDAVYALMQRLRDAHADLEIESCSSGGARTDYGVLQHTDRIWTSDSNDALDRQDIQRGASYFFPLNIMGAHVGPETCHITGRRLTMELRAATAFFGHMGMELNLFEESDEDLEILKKAISLHKQHRNVLHEGRFVRLDGSDYQNIVGVISNDNNEALFSCTKLTGHSTTLPGTFKFTGLDPARRYRTKIIWPLSKISVTSPSIIEAADLTGNGTVFSGEALMKHGIQLPVMFPETCLIYHLKAE